MADYSLEELQSTDYYKGLDEAEKAKFNSDFQASQAPTAADKVAGTAKNLAQDVQNITNPNYDTLKDIPEALPNTQNIQKGAAGGKSLDSYSWDDITSTNAYKNASDVDKYAIRQDYEKQGGVAEEANPGFLRSAKTASQGAYFSVRDAATNLVYGTGVLASDIVNKSDEVLNTITGQDPNNSMLGNWSKQSSQYLQKSLNDLNQGSAVQENATGVSTTEAGKVATKYVAPIAEGGAILASGGTLAIPLAVGAAGSHYANTEPEKKSIATSLTVGAMQQLANEMLPGSGGRIANIAEEGAQKFFSNVASPTVNNILSKSVGATVRATETGSLGYAGGYGVGTGTALAEGKSLKEAHEQGLESGKEGLAMGIGFHGAGEVYRFATKPKVSEASPLTFRNKVDNQTEEIDKTQNATGAERQQAFSNADERNAAAAHNIVEEAGLKSTQQTVRAGGLGEAGNVSEKAGDKAFADLEGVKQNYNDTVETFKQSIQSSNTRNINDVIETTKNHVGDEALTPENKLANEAVKRWQSLAKDRMKAQQITNINYENLTGLAQREHDAFLNMQSLAPEAAEFVKSNWDNPFNNNTKGYDPIAHANEIIAADKYLDAVGTKLRSASDITNPSALSKALKWAIPSAAHIGLWSHGGGVAEHAILATGEAGLGAAINYGKSRMNARKTAKGRASQLQEGAEATTAINKAQAGVKTAHEAPETPVTEEGYRETRRTREQASIEAQRQAQARAKAEEVKQRFAGHEDLQKQITPENYNNKEHLANLRAQLVERNTAAKAQAKQAEREAAAKAEEANNKQEVSDFKNAYPHLNQFFAEATRNLKASGKPANGANFEKEVNALPTGKKPLANGEKVKTPFAAGSKAEFHEDIRKGFAPEAARVEQQAAVEAYFSDKNKVRPNGSLKVAEQKKLHNTLAEIARNHYGDKYSNEANNSNEYWKGKSERADIRSKIATRNYQRDTVENTITEAFKDSGLSERSMNKFMKAKLQELNGKEFASTKEFKDHLDTIKSQVKEMVETKKQPTESKPKSEPNKTEPEENKLTDTKNNNIRNKYISKLADTVGTKDFDKIADEFETFLETNELTDTSTSKYYHNFRETLQKIHERKARGITDPEALISAKDWSDSTSQGVKTGSYILHALGVSEKPAFKTELQRKALEETSTPEAKAEKVKADKLAATQKANREKRKVSNARLNMKAKK